MELNSNDSYVLVFISGYTKVLASNVEQGVDNLRLD